MTNPTGTLLSMEAPARIEVEGGTRLILVWDDHTRTVIPASVLRAACQCAHCRSESGARLLGVVLSRPNEVTIDRAALVGAYGINFEFAPDAHGTGIFTFEQLAELGSVEPSGTDG